MAKKTRQVTDAFGVTYKAHRADPTIAQWQDEDGATYNVSAIDRATGYRKFALTPRDASVHAELAAVVESMGIRPYAPPDAFAWPPVNAYVQVGEARVKAGVHAMGVVGPDGRKWIAVADTSGRWMTRYGRRVDVVAVDSDGYVVGNLAPAVAADGSILIPRTADMLQVVPYDFCAKDVPYPLPAA